GIEGGVAGGVVGGDPIAGVAGGVVGGKPGGVLGGFLGDDGRVHFGRNQALPLFVERQDYPEYPEWGRIRGYEDQVVVRYIIGKDGRVKELTVLEPPERKMFESAAVDAIKLWRFRPLFVDGEAREVVTPVIEIAPQCTARAVRSLWEQIAFVRDQLDIWERRNGRSVRLQGFSAHFNIAFELSREERNRNRTIQKLALALAHLLPVPVIVLASNRRSAGVGVRPRRDRVEITLDFTPDPGLMAAATALIVGVVRD